MKKFLFQLSAIVAGVFWGTLGLFVRQLNSAGLSSTEVAFLRMAGGAIVAGLYMLITNPKAFHVRLKDLWIVLCTGAISIFGFSICFFTGVQTVDLGIATVLLYMSPIYVMLFGAILFKEKITRIKIAALVIAIISCILVAGVNLKSFTISTGILLCLASGVFYGSYSIFGKFAFNKGYGSFTLIFYTFLICAVCCAFTVDFEKLSTLFVPSAGYLPWMIGIGIVTAFIPYVFYAVALKNIEAGHASILASSELVAEAIIGAIAYSETISTSSMMGIVLIFVAIALLNIKTKTKRK